MQKQLKTVCTQMAMGVFSRTWFSETGSGVKFGLKAVVADPWSGRPCPLVDVVTQYNVFWQSWNLMPNPFKFCEMVSLFHIEKLMCNWQVVCMFFYIGGITVSVVAFFFTIKFLFELAARVVSFLQNEDRERRGDRSIYDYVRGNYLDPRSCKVSWDWKDPYEVGHSMAFRVHVRECFCLCTLWDFWVTCFPELFSLGVTRWNVNSFPCFSALPRNLGIVSILKNHEFLHPFASLGTKH